MTECDHVVTFQLHYDMIYFMNIEETLQNFQEEINNEDRPNIKTIQDCIKDISNWDCAEGFFDFCPNCGEKNITREEFTREI